MKIKKLIFLCFLNILVSVNAIAAQCVVVDSDINEKYSGECKDGMANGKGIATGKDKYEGGFINGLKSGYGTYEWPYGMIYKGEYSNDKRNGFGTMTVPKAAYLATQAQRSPLGHWQGDIYIEEGIYKDSMLINPCTGGKNSDSCINWVTDSNTGCKAWKANPEPNETITYTGECKDGIANGKGTVQWYKNGDLRQISNGYYVNGRLHGKGKTTWKGGPASGDDWYVGEFFEGSITGFGEKTYRCNCGAWSCHQCIDRGVFKEGKLIGSAPDEVNNISEYKAWQKREKNKQVRETQEYDERVSRFRKSLAIGDESSLGIVTDIRGKIVKIQTTESQCTQRDSTNSCLNWIENSVEKWVQLNNVYPK